MVLIIQIALGILLGFLLIEYRQRLGRWALGALKVCLAFVAIAAVVTVVAYLMSFAGLSGSDAPKWLAQVRSLARVLVGLVLFLVLFVFGAMGLLLLVRKVIGRWVKIEVGPEALVVMGIIGVLLTWPIAHLLNSLTPYEELVAALQRWDRENGFGGDGYALVNLSLVLWPWAIILVAERFDVDFYEQERASAQADQSSGLAD